MTLLELMCVTLYVFGSVNGYQLTILHTNDVHARFDEFNTFGTDCSSQEAAAGKCFGGVARRHTKVTEIRSTHENVLFLDAGDQFMGTLWFYVYEGQAASYFMNLLGYNVSVKAIYTINLLQWIQLESKIVTAVFILLTLKLMFATSRHA